MEQRTQKLPTRNLYPNRLQHRPRNLSDESVKALLSYLVLPSIAFGVVVIKDFPTKRT
jgi:hypothetical protein